MLLVNRLKRLKGLVLSELLCMNRRFGVVMMSSSGARALSVRLLRVQWLDLEQLLHHVGRHV